VCDDDAFERQPRGVSFADKVCAVEQQPSSARIGFPGEVTIRTHERVLP